ncbi:hypothetical protein ABZ819_08935 [Streptomyces venezuelae]|uniref:hypothetical protein n=1 Tax=Streptomyces venezuelae TaxID=54571 RepID=UPI00342BE496
MDAAGLLPHAPHIKALDRELAARGIPPGRLLIYTAAYPGQHARCPAEQRLCAYLIWDATRCSGRGGP